jgi:hypothetical protein
VNHYAGFMRKAVLPSRIHMPLRANLGQRNGNRRRPWAPFRRIQSMARQSGERACKPFGKASLRRSTGLLFCAAAARFPHWHCAVPNTTSNAAVECSTVQAFDLPNGCPFGREQTRARRQCSQRPPASRGKDHRHLYRNGGGGMAEARRRSAGGACKPSSASRRRRTGTVPWSLQVDVEERRRSSGRLTRHLFTEALTHRLRR